MGNIYIYIVKSEFTFSQPLHVFSRKGLFSQQRMFKCLLFNIKFHQFHDQISHLNEAV